MACSSASLTELPIPMANIEMECALVLSASSFVRCG